MNTPATAAELMERPLKEVLSCLEESFFHLRPPRDVDFYLDLRVALFARAIAEDEHETLIRALIIIARRCFAAALPREGLTALQRGEDFIDGLADTDVKRHFFTVRGALYLDLSDFPGAFDSYATGLEIARAQGNRESEARAMVNLAALLGDFGVYWDALKMGERVLAMHAEQALDPMTVSTMLANMAEACLATQQAERGIEFCSRSLMMGPDQEAPQRAQKCETQVTLARLHLLRGRIASAEREMVAARVYDTSTGFSRVKLRLQIATALIEHEKGGLQPAIQSLKSLLATAGADSSAAKEALSALITIYEKEGQPNAALKYLQRLSALIGNIDVETVRERLAALGFGEFEADEPVVPVGDNFFDDSDIRFRTASLRRNLIDSQVEVLERLAVAAELRDDITGMHCYRVGKWANLIALEMGLPVMEADAFEIAARLHDIGKIAVPDHILTKPGKLTAAEFEVIRRHAVMGARLLSRSKTAQIRLAEKVALSHHERWDGTGYPQGLAGEKIPLAGRITAVADVYDALAHERPYKHAWTETDALAMVKSLSGTAFDPAVVTAFLSVAESLRALGQTLDAAIEGRLKRSRIMRIREFVMADAEREEAALATAS